MSTGYKYLNCSVCGRRRDEVTGACPTPEACAQLRAPHQRIARQQAESAARARADQLDATTIGVSRVGQQAAASLPGQQQRRTEAQERAARGWRTRRAV